MNKFATMKIGDDVDFYALVESSQKRYTPNKSAYYGITLSDGDTSIDARVWDVNLIEKNGVVPGTVFHFKAHINEYAGKAQYVINGLEVPNENEVNIKDLVVGLIAKVPDDYFVFPAAMSMHHNYFNGLAYHTYSMLRMADKYLEIYDGMNSDLLYAGILLHDIGKTKELTGPKAPLYTEDGNLLGHIVIGLQMVAVEAANQNVENTEEYKALSHLIASHHGELEYGSPKEPGIMEAFALHFIDLADAKLAPISAEVLKTQKGNSTAPIASLNRKSVYVPNIK